MNYRDRFIQVVRDSAAKWQYREIDHQENIKMLSFSNGPCRINVYYSRMTVATCLHHPKQGDTQLFRKNVTFDELDLIFQNPRAHLNKGYKRK